MPLPPKPVEHANRPSSLATMPDPGCVAAPLVMPATHTHERAPVVCALTAQLWREGWARTVGAEDEGLVIIPDVAAAAADRARPAVRRAAEEREPYRVDDPAP